MKRARLYAAGALALASLCCLGAAWLESRRAPGGIGASGALSDDYEARP